MFSYINLKNKVNKLRLLLVACVGCAVPDDSVTSQTVDNTLPETHALAAASSESINPPTTSRGRNYRVIYPGKYPRDPELRTLVVYKGPDGEEVEISLPENMGTTRLQQMEAYRVPGSDSFHIPQTCQILVDDLVYLKPGSLASTEVDEAGERVISVRFHSYPHPFPRTLPLCVDSAQFEKDVRTWGLRPGGGHCYTEIWSFDSPYTDLSTEPEALEVRSQDRARKMEIVAALLNRLGLTWGDQPLSFAVDEIREALCPPSITVVATTSDHEFSIGNKGERRADGKLCMRQQRTGTRYKEPAIGLEIPQNLCAALELIIYYYLPGDCQQTR